VYLSDRDIKALLDEMKIEGPLAAHPFEVGQVQPCSIDLRVSNVFWRPSRRGITARLLRRRAYAIDLRHSKAHDLDPRRDWKKLDLAEGDVVTIKPRGVLMGRVYERFQIPPGYAGKASTSTTTAAPLCGGVIAGSKSSRSVSERSTLPSAHSKKSSSASASRTTLSSTASMISLPIAVSAKSRTRTELLDDFAKAEDRRRLLDLVSMGAPAAVVGGILGSLFASFGFWHIVLIAALLISCAVALRGYLRRDSGYLGRREFEAENGVRSSGQDGERAVG